MGGEPEAEDGVEGAIGIGKGDDISDIEGAVVRVDEVVDAMAAGGMAGEHGDVMSGADKGAGKLAMTSPDVEDVKGAGCGKKGEGDGFLDLKHPGAGRAMKASGVWIGGGFDVGFFRVGAFGLGGPDGDHVT